MFKFENITEKSKIEKHIEFWEIKIKKTDKNRWNITDRCGNEWEVVFKSVDRWSVWNVPHYGEKLFGVQFDFTGYTAGNGICQILKVVTNNRNYTDPRYTKKYGELCCMITSFIKYGYFKL